MATTDPANWMSTLDRTLTLKDVCMPGSHDAGMYKTDNWITSLALTQNKNLNEQLHSGIRYFDLRPQYWSDNKSEDRFYVHHGAATGPLLKEILSDISDFMKDHKSETVLLSFSHHKDFPEKKSGDKKYKDYLDYLKLIDKHLKPYLLPTNKFSGSITKMPLSALSGKVIPLFDFSDDEFTINVTNAKLDGYYLQRNSLKIHDDYADSKNYYGMIIDQMKKYGRFNTSDELFLLNWTLTPTTANIMPGQPSVYDYAKDINPKLTDFGHARDFLFKPNYYGHMINVINGDYWSLSGDKVLTACFEIMDNNKNVKAHGDSRKGLAVMLASRATKKHLAMNFDLGFPVEDNDTAYAKWYKWHLSENRYRLQNAGTGLYLSAMFNLTLALRINMQVCGELEYTGDDNQKWHLEDLGSKTFHVVNAGIKKHPLISSDRLDVSNDRAYMQDPNDGDYQKWEMIGG